MALAVPAPVASAKPFSHSPSIVSPAAGSHQGRNLRVGVSMAPKTSARPLAAHKPAMVAKDTSSSSGTVFAKPTKEWVIPDRAKPGRKVSEDEPDNKRQSQNRLSQRAHRARRTDYISTLEERIRQYEADEIHSNVRLQEVARALKADNERLKGELTASKSAEPEEGWDKIRKGMEEEIVRLRTEIARLRGSSSGSGGARGDAGVMPAHRFWVDHDSAPRKRPAPLDCPICPNPDPDCPCQTGRASTSASVVPSLAPSPPRPARADPIAHHDTSQGLVGEHEHTCGLCQSHEECLCTVGSPDISHAQVDVKPVLPLPPSPKMALSPIAVLHDDSCGLCTSAEFCACKITSTTSSSPPRVKPSFITSAAAGVSITAVPLRARPKKYAKATIWAIDPPLATDKRAREAVCTGDPSNCDACKNDSFGREFCSHLFAADAQKCAKCSSKHAMSATTSSTSSVPTTSGFLEGNAHAKHVHDDIMRPEQAWKALKAHPNAKLASLALLADVVARRTITCSSSSGSPPTDSEPFPADAEAPASPSSRAIQDALGDAHERKGKRRVMVESGAVREALRMLDEAGAGAGAGESSVDGDGGQGRGAKRRKL